MLSALMPETRNVKLSAKASETQRPDAAKPCRELRKVKIRAGDAGTGRAAWVLPGEVASCFSLLSILSMTSQHALSELSRRLLLYQLINRNRALVAEITLQRQLGRYPEFNANGGTASMPTRAALLGRQ